MSELLRRFNGDKQTKEALFDFLLGAVNDYALERIDKRQDVSGIVEAKEIIKKAFEDLDIIYAIPDKQGDTENTSR